MDCTNYPHCSRICKQTSGWTIGRMKLFQRAVHVWLLIACTLLWPGRLHAQTNQAGATAPTNRFLIIVETSHSMSRRVKGTFDAVKAILDSRLNGQLHAGDSFGIWTFNENLYTEQFPIQNWSEGAELAFAAAPVNLLQPKMYEGRAAFG